MNAATARTEKTWMVTLGILSVVYYFIGLVMPDSGRIDVHLNDTYFILEHGSRFFIAMLWVVYFFHLGVFWVSQWSPTGRTLAVLIAVAAVLLNGYVIFGFYGNYHIATDFAWPEGDEDARRILLKQQEFLEQSYRKLAVPFGVILLVQTGRLVQLFISKKKHAEPERAGTEAG